MERILGPAMGDFVRALHEEHGVVFHLEDTVAGIDGRQVTLKSGGTLEADLVVIGVGVRPRPGAGREGRSHRSIAAWSSTPSWQTSAPGIFAAGDIARWPDPHSGQAIRVEHWVVAERQGQVAALQHARAAPDVRRRAVLLEPALRRADQLCRPRREVGRARGRRRHRRPGTAWCATRRDGRTLAVASIYRDVASLQAEVAMERRRQQAR